MWNDSWSFSEINQHFLRFLYTEVNKSMLFNLLCVLQDELTHLKFTAHQIETWLEKDHATKGGWQSALPGAPGNENGDKEVSGQSRPHRQRAAPDGGSSEDGGEVPEQNQQLPAAFLQGLALAQHMMFNSTARRTKRAFNAADRQSYGE